MAAEMRTTGRSDLVDLEVQIHGETDHAVKISLDGDRAKAVWVPRSQIEIERTSGKFATVTMPEWLAADRKLV